MTVKHLLYILLISIILLLTGCGVGGMNEEGEKEDTPSYYVPEPDCYGDPEFTYNFTQTSEDLSFHAYGRTHFRMIHYGMCNYVMSLYVVSTNATYEILSRGFGGSNVLKVYDLIDEDYILSVETDEECQWSIEVTSLQKIGCDDDSEIDLKSISDTGEESVDDTGISEDYRELEKNGCNCTGCCLDNGGVICLNGFTVCADGTPLSEICEANGCEASGCNGCEQ